MAIRKRKENTFITPYKPLLKRELTSNIPNFEVCRLFVPKAVIPRERATPRNASVRKPLLTITMGNHEGMIPLAAKNIQKQFSTIRSTTISKMLPNSDSWWRYRATIPSTPSSAIRNIVRNNAPIWLYNPSRERQKNTTINKKTLDRVIRFASKGSASGSEVSAVSLSRKTYFLRFQ